MNVHRRTQSDYYYESPYNGNVKKRNENTNYLNTDTDDLNYNPTKDAMLLDPNTQSVQKFASNEDIFIPNRENKVENEPNELLTDRGHIQNPEKKW